jgi:general secretion pathway protein H
VTLIEVLIVVALIGVMTGGMFLGMGALSSARLKRSATLIASAVRVAYNRANATSRPVRLVFDFDERSITLEEGAGRMLLRHGERTGGAQGADEAEQEAVAAADEILEGPKAPRASFQPVRADGLMSDGEKPGQTLSSGIYYRHVEVEHEDDPVESERAYLYFWPGGQTERAAIQLMRGSDPSEAEESDIITLLVAPLTGKVSIVGGAADMPRPMTDEEASEREDW